MRKHMAYVIDIPSILISPTDRARIAEMASDMQWRTTSSARSSMTNGATSIERIAKSMPYEVVTRTGTLNNYQILARQATRPYANPNTVTKPAYTQQLTIDALDLEIKNSPTQVNMYQMTRPCVGSCLPTQYHN